MRNAMLDGMLGLTIGDALGDPVQFMSRKQVQKRGLVTGMEEGGPFGTPAGTWTDDSSLALATLDSLVRKPQVDLTDIAQNYYEWLYNGKFTPFGHSFDIGRTCMQAIQRFGRTHSPLNCGITGEYANGNGALMRILPTSVFFALRVLDGRMGLDEAVRGVESIAAITHNHHRTNMICGLHFFLTKAILSEEGALARRMQSGFDEGFAYYDQRDEIREEEIDCLRNEAEFAKTPEDAIRAGGYVVDAFKAACWSLHGTASFRDALLKAVNLGDDSDTVGAITGGLAGLYYGHEGIPGEWLDKLQRREWIEEMCKKVQL